MSLVSCSTIAFSRTVRDLILSGFSNRPLDIVPALVSSLGSLVYLTKSDFSKSDSILVFWAVKLRTVNSEA